MPGTFIRCMEEILLLTTNISDRMARYLSFVLLAIVHIATNMKMRFPGIVFQQTVQVVQVQDFLHQQYLHPSPAYCPTSCWFSLVKTRGMCATTVQKLGPLNYVLSSPAKLGFPQSMLSQRSFNYTLVILLKSVPCGCSLAKPCAGPVLPAGIWKLTPKPDTPQLHDLAPEQFCPDCTCASLCDSSGKSPRLNAEFLNQNSTSDATATIP